MSGWIAIGALAVVAVAIPLSMMTASWVLRPSAPSRHKQATYESGEIPTGTPGGQYTVQYYLVALLFLIFDVETVLIFPWAVVFGDAVGEAGITYALVPMLIFIGILLLGLVWAWRTGALRWVRSQVADKQSRVVDT